VLGLDENAIADAISIAGTHNNTLTESMRGDMASIKASIEATTAKAGVEAALMAKHGLTGPKAIFEGTFGWINVVAGDLDVESLAAAPGGRFRIMDACMKPYIGHALSQGHIQAAIDVVRDHRIDVSRIVKIEAGYPEQVLRQPSMDTSKL
jgi:2-methylcitrate dehydratase